VQHWDREQLVLLALGEQDDESALPGHLASCVGCRAEFVALRRTVLIARESGPEREQEGPPPRVWGSIVAELGLTSTGPADSREERLDVPRAERRPYAPGPVPAVEGTPTEPVADGEGIAALGPPAGEGTGPTDSTTAAAGSTTSAGSTTASAASATASAPSAGGSAASTPATGTPAPGTAPPGETAHAGKPPGETAHAGKPPGALRSVSDPRGRAQHRRAAVPRRTLWLATAAAAVVGLLAGLGVSPWRGERSGGDAAREEVVATSRLAALGNAPPGARGEAQVIRTGGRTELRVDASGLPDPDGFYEVWMLNPATGAVRSMGVLSTAGPTTLPVAPDVDLEALPEVDVSVEPYDGDAGHSSKSVLRGRLQG